VYAEVQPTLRDRPVFPGLVDAVRFKVSAPTLLLEFDTRDNVFTPTRGVYAETSYLERADNFSRSGERLTLNRARMAPLAGFEAVGSK
jgi:hypothetical protein